MNIIGVAMDPMGDVSTWEGGAQAQFYLNSTLVYGRRGRGPIYSRGGRREGYNGMFPFLTRRKVGLGGAQEIWPRPDF